MRKFTINPKARKAVQERSAGICERCHQGTAVHLHHLTYDRAGKERPEDLLHICIVCHCMLHPQKAPDIFDWEANRQAVQVPRVKKYHVNRHGEPERKRPEPERPEEEDPEPAWNLKQYESSGYCIEDVEHEEDRW